MRSLILALFLAEDHPAEEVEVLHGVLVEAAEVADHFPFPVPETRPTPGRGGVVDEPEVVVPEHVGGVVGDKLGVGQKGFGVLAAVVALPTEGEPEFGRQVVKPLAGLEGGVHEGPVEGRRGVVVGLNGLPQVLGLELEHFGLSRTPVVVGVEGVGVASALLTRENSP